MNRLLLPFTHGIDARAMEYALQVARCSHAVLVGVVFRPISPDRNVGLRLTDIEQANDFLELLYCQAKRMRVPLERMELQSRDLVRSLRGLYGEMDCNAILIFMRGGKSVLLTNEEAQRLFLAEALPLFLVRLASRYPVGSTLKERLKFWWKRRSIAKAEEIKLIQMNSLQIEKLSGWQNANF